MRPPRSSARRAGWSPANDRAAPQDTHEPVAIKAVIRSKLTTKLLENLESEISILKRITHRNIVELKDCLVSPPRAGRATLSWKLT